MGNVFKRHSVVCMIPARLGSQRVKDKNIRMLGDKKLVEWVIQSAKEAKIFDGVYLNASEEVFKGIAEKNGIWWYRRPDYLSRGDVSNDRFMRDFMENIKCDIVIQILPTSPFITADTIREFVKSMYSVDTLVSVGRMQIECIYDGVPLNFITMQDTKPSQELTPVFHYACGLMGWRRDNYLKSDVGAYHGGVGRTEYFELSGAENIDIDTEEDFKLAEKIAS